MQQMGEYKAIQKQYTCLAQEQPDSGKILQGSIWFLMVPATHRLTTTEYSIILQ